MEKNGVSVYSVNMYNPGHHFAWQITQGVIFILSFFGWLTVILSGFLIVNTIVALMMQQTKQIGVMKAIGAGMEQILPMYLVLLLGFGGLAFVISVPLSSWAGSLMNTFMADYLNYDMTPVKLFPDVVILQGLISFLTPLIAASIPVINSLRKPVREALSDFGLTGGTKNKGAGESRFEFISRPCCVHCGMLSEESGISLTFCKLVLRAQFHRVFTCGPVLLGCMQVQG